MYICNLRRGDSATLTYENMRMSVKCTASRLGPVTRRPDSLKRLCQQQGEKEFVTNTRCVRKFSMMYLRNLNNKAVKFKTSHHTGEKEKKKIYI